jgi:glutathione S-transferase
MIARYALLEAAIPYENRRMDIHLAKEQLAPWYIKINPKMTVPSLVDGSCILTDSQDILNYAANRAAGLWMDSNEEFKLNIQQIVYAHYNITIERLTFSKALTSVPLVRVIVPRMLSRIIKKLEKERETAANQEAVDGKIAQNQQRLSFFTEGNLLDKLELERKSVCDFLEKLPIPKDLLFGDKISSADIVAATLCTRLKMIGEYKLIKSSALTAWYERIRQRPAYKNADMWSYFQPWRIVLKR